MRGTRRLTSRRLVALAEELPEKSRYKTVRRDPDIGGDWDTTLYLYAAIVNELRLGRVDQSRYHGGDMAYTPVESPAQAADKRDARLLARAAHDHLVAKMSAPKPSTVQRHRTVTVETDMDKRRRAAQAMRTGGGSGA